MGTRRRGRQDEVDDGTPRRTEALTPHRTEALTPGETGRMLQVIAQLRDHGAGLVHRTRLGGDVVNRSRQVDDVLSAASLEALVVGALVAASVDPARIYAYQHTGRLVTSENLPLIDAGAVRSWREAVDRYRRTHR